MDVGFVGNGEMADAIMDRLRQAGHRLHHDRHGRHDRSAFRDQAGMCDVVMMLLPDARAVEAALFGDARFANDGFAGALPPDTLVIDLSRIPPSEASANAARLSGMGVLTADAPLAPGFTPGFTPGFAIDLGGSDAACARAEPLLRLLSDGVVRAGGAGDGQRAHLARTADRKNDDPDGLHRLLRLMAFDGPAEPMLSAS
ncbi:NAD(P)-dependent oxidoreductase [Azospirillum melinis]|uniref:NAD(P)-dependent oxidoreductase n=1 Tax=Azospirillum melinis TaxID=328839 RepID=A0ABX2KMN2_9PROT|nr:NAD(P)-binding domain-containing protein [Azospirillum melinis]NUB04369.1 NAD(P)-dependent oxidoreductase [Azospirillum melinis]